VKNNDAEEEERCTACLTSTSYKHTSTNSYKHGRLGIDVQPSPSSPSFVC